MAVNNAISMTHLKMEAMNLIAKLGTFGVLWDSSFSGFERFRNSRKWVQECVRFLYPVVKEAILNFQVFRLLKRICPMKASLNWHIFKNQPKAKTADPAWNLADNLIPSQAKKSKLPTFWDWYNWYLANIQALQEGLSWFWSQPQISFCDDLTLDSAARQWGAPLVKTFG